jgi:hypothetical protein
MTGCFANDVFFYNELRLLFEQMNQAQGPKLPGNPGALKPAPPLSLPPIWRLLASPGKACLYSRPARQPLGKTFFFPAPQDSKTPKIRITP